jgi:hypothetical protein
LHHSTITGNISEYGGAIYNESLLGIDMSTISGNSTTALLPGIYNNGEMKIEHSTINQPMGYAIYNSLGGSTTIYNTAIIGQCGAVGSITSLGGSLESPGDTCSLGTNDMKNVSTATLLMELLAYNGGLTKTHRFGKGSVAIDFAGAADCDEEDQRHFDRPLDGNRDGDKVCDVGAVEYHLDEIFMYDFEGGYLVGWSAIVQ